MPEAIGISASAGRFFARMEYSLARRNNYVDKR